MIDLKEAQRVLEAAYPMQGVTVEQNTGGGGCYKVRKSDGEVIGSAFDLQTACRQAVQPALKAEAQRRLDLDKARVEDFKAFMQFLRERFTDEFNEYKARPDTEASKPVGLQPDPTRLVSLVP